MKVIAKYTVVILTILLIGCRPPLYAASSETRADAETDVEDQLETEFDAGDEPTEFDPETETETFDEEIGIFEEDAEDDPFGDDAKKKQEDGKSSFFAALLSTARFTLKHELFYKITRPDDIKSNRSSIRLEYSRSLGPHFFVQLDTKETLFWKNDHRAQAENKEIMAENFTKEAFLQASFADTSIKAGIQNLIWGESEGGAVTDVISPRDYSETFFISLEEARIGQPMLLMDQFTFLGDFSAFFIPYAEFNQTPEENTAYHYDEFNEPVHFRKENSDGWSDYEIGGRWKKTFGQSDVALMAADLIENDYTYRFDGTTADGDMIITKTQKRFSMVGLTFNYVRGNFLYKGEMSVKSPRHFNTSTYQIKRKDVLDTALGLEYSPGGAYTLGLELVNRHIMDWDNDLIGVPENASSVVLPWEKDFLNEDLSISLLSIYYTPYEGYLHTLKTTYKWTDHLSFKLEAFCPDISNAKNDLRVYRDQKQVAVKILFQF
jgi:hypothetical protein